MSTFRKSLLALVAVGGLFAVNGVAHATPSAPDISPEYTWTVGVDELAQPTPRHFAQPPNNESEAVVVPAVGVTFDAIGGMTGTGGSIEVQGQGPRDVDRRLLSCDTRVDEVRLIGAPNITVTAFTWTADYVAQRLNDGSCTVIG